MTAEPDPPDQLAELVAVMRRLRADCAWNREQTHESLVPYLIEESAELVEAIETGDRDGMLEELGDVLYQVLFHAEIAATDGGFDIQDVAAKAAAKMIRRHPHVFGDVTATTPAEIVEVWNAVKAAEKAARTSVLEGIPLGMPALALADKVLGRAEQVGVSLSAAETAAPAGVPAPAASRAPRTEAALGRELLATVAAARRAGLDSERALRGALRELQQAIRVAETHAAESRTTAIDSPTTWP